MRILVIDDDTSLLAVVKRLLTLSGYSVDCVDNADAAIPMVRETRYDFVLVDYRMPGHDGIWFLKNASLPRDTKALLITAFADRGVIEQMFDAGISGYVTKPFDGDELLRHLRFHSGDGEKLQDQNSGNLQKQQTGD